MTLVWVVGSGGLLGSALCRELRRSDAVFFAPAARFNWADPAALEGQFAQAVDAFASRMAVGQRWEVYWAAGVGTMGSAESALATETCALGTLIHCLASDDRLAAGRGALAFASSAGAIYAGSADEVITESTTPIPTNAYGREKLKQEALLRSSALAARNVTVLLARISTLYGSGQSSGKAQGLLTHVARCVLRSQPVQIYVPFDTIRDYIAVDDAAAMMIDALRSAAAGPSILTRIIASETPATIAEIVSIFRRVARRNPRIVTSASRLSHLYTRRVQFRSTASQGEGRTPRRSLLVGIAQVLAAERAALMQSTHGIAK